MARVGLDLDGVCYDFDGAYRFLIEEHFGIAIPRPSTEWDFASKWLRENGHSEEVWKWLWNQGVHHGLFRHGHVLKGAVRAAHALDRAGHEVVVLTSRPKTARADTLMWLGFHNFPVGEFHLLPHQPKSAVRPHCDVYIDDSAANAADLIRNTNATVLLWDRPWNQNTRLPMNERLEIVYDWNRVIEVCNGGAAYA